MNYKDEFLKARARARNYKPPQNHRETDFEMRAAAAYEAAMRAYCQHGKERWCEAYR